MSRIANHSSRMNVYGVLCLVLQSEDKQKYGAQQKGPWQQCVCMWHVGICVNFEGINK